MAESAKRRALNIVYRGQAYVLDFADLGPRDDIAVRRETGMPVSSFVMQDRFSLDSMAVIVWVTMRKYGSTESFDRFLDGFPSMTEMSQMIEDGRMSISSVEDDSVAIDAEVIPDPS